MNPDIKSLFKKYEREGCNYIFLVSNPISVFISKMLIEQFNIDMKKVFVFSLRKTDARLITKNYNVILSKRTDSIIGKLIWGSPQGKRILKKIPKTKFVLFTEWAYREAEILINSKYCSEHVYLEMGQHSYMNIPTFSPKKLSFKNRFLKNWKNRLSPIDEFAHYYFRDDASFFVGMMEDVFPKIENEKKYILKNFKDLKKFYNPKLTKNKVIGLTCASRRIQRSDWKNMLIRLFENLPAGAIVKAHPSFYSSESIFKDFIDTFNEVSKGDFELCPNDVILELEMLFEKKVFYGSQTALSKYAEFSGSKFNLLTLY